MLNIYIYVYYVIMCIENNICIIIIIYIYYYTYYIVYIYYIIVVHIIYKYTLCNYPESQFVDYENPKCIKDCIAPERIIN